MKCSYFNHRSGKVLYLKQVHDGEMFYFIDTCKTAWLKKGIYVYHIYKIAQQKRLVTTKGFMSSTRYQENRLVTII